MYLFQFQNYVRKVNMYFRNVQNCEKIGICVIDVNLWWGVGGVLVGWKLNKQGVYGLSLIVVLKVGMIFFLGK